MPLYNVLRFVTKTQQNKQQRGEKMKSQIEGTAISIALNGTPINVGSDGHIGKIMGLCTARIEVIVSKEKINSVFAITVDGKKNVILKKNLSETPDKLKIYRNNIEVKSNGQVLHTEYPNNHLRLLAISKGGNIQVWEIAIVSQNGDFFVTQQKTWDTFCYNNHERVSCPLFEGPKGWPQMVEILKNLLTDQIDQLPLISQKKKEDINLQNTKILINNRGVVVWFNQAQGIGVIKTIEGPARAHWKDINRKNSRLAYLKPGELVSFHSIVPPRLTKGRKTMIRFDAVGISPV